jgi:hypothetical protein
MKSRAIVFLLVIVDDRLNLILKLTCSYNQENCLVKDIVFNGVGG